MHLAELLFEVFFGPLALLVRGAESTNESGIIGQARNVLPEKLPVANVHHLHQGANSVKAVEVGGEQVEVIRAVGEAYLEVFALPLAGFRPFVWLFLSSSIWSMAFFARSSPM